LARNLKLITIIFLVITAAMAVWYGYTSSETLLSLVITFGTISYHFVMRLLTGLVFNSVMKNKANYRRRWYQVSQWEMDVYEKLKVKKWKNKMPTYERSLFDPRLHTLDEVVQVMCQAELVHETIAVLSFLPIIAGIWLGSYPVFIITSLVAAAIDMMFVVMQRYNRRRMINIIQHEKA
jgi:hypothetical protein